AGVGLDVPDGLVQLVGSAVAVDAVLTGVEGAVAVHVLGEEVAEVDLARGGHHLQVEVVGERVARVLGPGQRAAQLALVAVDGDGAALRGPGGAGDAADAADVHPAAGVQAAVGHD